MPYRRTTRRRTGRAGRVYRGRVAPQNWQRKEIGISIPNGTSPVPGTAKAQSITTVSTGVNVSRVRRLSLNVNATLERVSGKSPLQGEAYVLFEICMGIAVDTVDFINKMKDAAQATIIRKHGFAYFGLPAPQHLWSARGFDLSRHAALVDDPAQLYVGWDIKQVFLGVGGAADFADFALAGNLTYTENDPVHGNVAVSLPDMVAALSGQERAELLLALGQHAGCVEDPCNSCQLEAIQEQERQVGR